MRRTMICVVTLLIATGAVYAKDYTVGSLQIKEPWSRATPKGAKVGAGYLTITNTGKDADRLLGGTLEVADHVEVHEMSMDGSVMKMHPVEGGLEIKPGATVTLKPGAYHLMFMDLKNGLAQNEKIRGMLKFEKAGDVSVEFAVGAIAAQTSIGEGGGMNMKGMGGSHGGPSR